MVKRSLTIAIANEQYQEESWIPAYTDGLSKYYVINGGAGVFIKFPPGNRSTSKVSTGTYSYNYNAEIQALTLIKAANRPKRVRDDYHLLNRLEQVTLMRDHTGHSRLNVHMFKRFKLVPSPTCNCSLEDHTGVSISTNWVANWDASTHLSLWRQRRTGKNCLGTDENLYYDVN